MQPKAAPKEANANRATHLFSTSPSRSAVPPSFLLSTANFPKSPPSAISNFHQYQQQSSSFPNPVKGKDYLISYLYFLSFRLHPTSSVVSASLLPSRETHFPTTFKPPTNQPLPHYSSCSAYARLVLLSHRNLSKSFAPLVNTQILLLRYCARVHHLVGRLHNCSLTFLRARLASHAIFSSILFNRSVLQRHRHVWQA